MRDFLDDLAGTVEPVRRLIAGKSDREVRAICLEALRRWRKSAGKKVSLQMHGDFGRAVLQLLAETSTGRVDVNGGKEVFLNSQQDDFMAPVMDFVWWLIRSGLARPQGFSADRLLAFGMTAAGLRFLDAGDHHALAPGFLARLRSRHPDIPEDVLVLIEDAQACLDSGLLRPGVVLLGLAFETLVEHVLTDLASKALVDPKQIRRADAGDRIGMLKNQLSRLKFQDDERRLVVSAVEFADHLRERRNDAAHTKPRWPFDSLDEVEELLISAGRHVPHLWRITHATSA